VQQERGSQNLDPCTLHNAAAAAHHFQDPKPQIQSAFICPQKDFVTLNEVFRLLCGQTSLITTQHFKYTVVRGFSNSKGIFVAFFIIYQILSGPTTPVRFMCCSGLQRGCGIRLQEEPSRCRQRIYFPWYKLVRVLGSRMCSENAPFFLQKRNVD